MQLRPDDPDTLYNRACALSRLDRYADALVGLERAFEHGFTNFAHAQSDDDLRPLRDHPEYGPKFRDLIERYKKKDDTSDGDSAPA